MMNSAYASHLYLFFQARNHTNASFVGKHSANHQISSLIVGNTPGISPSIVTYAAEVFRYFQKFRSPAHKYKNIISTLLGHFNIFLFYILAQG